VESDVADRRSARWQLLLRQPPNMLDQFMVNKNISTGDAPIKVDPATAQILKLPTMVNPGVYPSQSHSAGWASRSIKTASPTTSRSP
jgi:hypothetical protein